MGLQSGQSRAGRCGWGKGKSSRTKIYCYKAAEKLHSLQCIDLKQSPENHSEVVLSNSDRNQRNCNPHCGPQFPVIFSLLSFTHPIPMLGTTHKTDKILVWKSIRLNQACLLEVVESCLVLWWIGFGLPGAPEEGRWLEGVQDAGWRW